MNVPNHIAIILDGNGRWAKERGMPRTYGHVKGCANLENICYDIKDLGVKYLTVYAFSTENWKRSREEVEALMKLFRSYLKKCIKISKKNNMRMKVIGDITAFAPDIQQSVRELEEYSKDFDGIYFQLALNYGSRDEIRRGMQKMAQDVKDGKVEPDSITEETIESYLDTAGVPDPDLMIRTSGEQRLSNFLLWQLAYSEFYFTPVAWPDFNKRLISGIVLVIIALATIISGSWILFFTLLAVSLIGMRELYKVMKVSDEHVTVLELVGYLGAVLYYIAMRFDFGSYGTMAIIISMILILFVYVFGYPKYRAEQVMAAFFGMVYVAVMLSFIYLTRNLPDGKFLVWLIFLCSWGCDTCAYCVGMLIGKHKMAPVLSPKKSIEGAVGGVVGAALLGVIYAAATQGKMAEYALICAVGALISMVGDLAASAIKRNQNIKDYGKLIPGHGGILDRFDSVIITAPVIYYLAKIILGI